MDWLPVNVALLKHPMNWVQIWLMLLILAIFFDVARQYHQQD